MSLPTQETIIETVREYIKDSHPAGAVLEVVPQGIRQDQEWWYVPIHPSIQPARRYEYYEALATVENELRKIEHLTVLLVPAAAHSEA